MTSNELGSLENQKYLRYTLIDYTLRPQMSIRFALRAAVFEIRCRKSEQALAPFDKMADDDYIKLDNIALRPAVFEMQCS